MKRRWICIVWMTLLGGCASGGDYKQYVDAQMEAIRQHQAQARPLVSIKAAPGQQITGLESIEINVPGQAPTIQQARGNEWAPVVGQAIGTIGIVGGIVAGGRAAIGIANAVGNAAKTPQANVSTVNTMSGTGVMGSGSYGTANTASTANSIGGSGAMGAGASFAAPTTTTTTNTTTTNTTTDDHAVTTTNSHNPVDNHAINAAPSDSHDLTCTTGPC